MTAAWIGATTRLFAILFIAMLTACAPRATGPSPNAPRGPADLPYYEVERIKSLSLQEMNVQIVRRVEVGDVEVLGVTYDAFDQPVAGPNGVVTVRWRQRAALFLPVGPLPTHKALAYNTHDVDLDSATNRKLGLGIAAAFGIPVLIHGWMPDVVAAVDGEGFHGTQAAVMQRLLDAGFESADGLPMDGRYFFNGNPLAKGDLVSMTLLQRLVESRRAIPIDQIAAIGISKAGHATWILGALDDRVTVLAPGGMYWHDTGEILERYGRDWNWRFPWRGGDEAPYDGLRRLFQTVWRLGDWMLRTEAGDVVDRTTMSTARWFDRIRARHVVVSGDLGFMPDQHDGPWPLLAENRALAHFDHPSWRYVRAFDGTGVYLNDGAGDMGLSLVAQVADLLVTDTVTPSTPAVRIDVVAPRTIQVTAQSDTDPGSPAEALAVYAVSDERGLRDRSAWRVATMGATGLGAWRAQLPAVPDGHGLTVIVVVRESVTRGGIRYYRSASSLPVERFPLPEFDSPAPRWRGR